MKKAHFNYRIGSTPNNISTFLERYFICGGSKWKPNNPIFFYFGDGKSSPFNQSQLDNDNSLYRFISNDQAIADYATLIRYIKISWDNYVHGLL